MGINYTSKRRPDLERSFVTFLVIRECHTESFKSLVHRILFVSLIIH